MVPNKLIQLLFTVETKLRSQHSSAVTKTPDLVCRRECKVWYVDSHPDGKFLSKGQVNSHRVWKQKAERAQYICERQWMNHSSLPPIDHLLSTGVALLGKNWMIYSSLVQGSAELGLTHHSQVYVPTPKTTEVAFSWTLDMGFFWGLFWWILFWDRGVTLPWWFCFVFFTAFQNLAASFYRKI